MASNQDNFFKTHGADELAQELRDLSRGMQNKILRSPMTKAVAEVRKAAKRYIKVDKGVAKKFIKSKTFTAKRGAKGIVGRIGVFTDISVPNGKEGVFVAKYAAVQNYGSTKVGKARNTTIPAQDFLGKALASENEKATNILLTEAQKKMDAFHAKRGDQGKV